MEDAFTEHGDFFKELEEALAEILKEERKTDSLSADDIRYTKLPPLVVQYLFLVRLGLDDSALSVIKTHTQAESGKKHPFIADFQPVIRELWPRQAIETHDKKGFQWWKYRFRFGEARTNNTGKKPIAKGKFKARPRARPV